MNRKLRDIDLEANRQAIEQIRGELATVGEISEWIGSLPPVETVQSMFSTEIVQLYSHVDHDSNHQSIL